MSWSIGTIGVICAALCLPAGVARGAEQGQQPFQLVRSLRSLQDLAAAGNAAARVQQRLLITQIAEQLVSADPAVWQDAKNVRAAIIYALSGGEPRALKALFSLPTLPGVDDKLLNGALAYGEGRSGDAAELLAGIDPRALEPGLGAQVALVRATLLAKKDAKKAAALLDDARILAPGTLIEEAALRREPFVVAGLGDAGAFEALASQYMRRFSNSIYAPSFREHFAAEVARMDYGRDAEARAKLGAMLQDLDHDSQLKFSLAIAREAVVKGRVGLAGFVAQLAGSLSAENSVDLERSKVYEAAALVVTTDYDRGMQVLKAADRTRLDGGDSELVAAVLSVGAEVRRWPLPVNETGEPASIEPLPVRPDQEQSPTIKTALRAIANTDELLGEGAK